MEGTKTKIYIVYREIQFRKEIRSPFPAFRKELEQARHRCQHHLFNEVTFTLTPIDSFHVQVRIARDRTLVPVPVPQFQLVDRNFNRWYKTYKASFDRVNYGLKFVHYNLSGRRDQLRIYLINGYTRNISFRTTTRTATVRSQTVSS